MSQDAFEARKGIGLLGGTFDPIHQGHLALAASALEQLKLQQIDFLLAPRPWQKSVLTSVTDRARMIEQAIRGNPRLKLNLTEVFRPGLTYTIDTLKALREKLGGNPVPLVLLMGQDQCANLKTWKSWQALTDYANLAVFNRGKKRLSVPQEITSWAEGKTVPPDLITASPSGSVCFFQMAPHEANSSEIRKLLAEPASLQNAIKLESWLPHGVALYINQHGLYRPKH